MVGGEKKHRILMVNLTNLDAGEGGALHQLSLAKYFIRYGHDVRLLVPARGARAELPRELAGAVSRTFSLTRVGLPASLDILLQIPALVWYRLDKGFEILYIRATALTVVVNVLARALGMVVIVEHNGWLSTERVARGGSPLLARLERRLQSWSARSAHLNRTVTKGLAGLLRQEGLDDNRVVVIGNGSDLSSFFPMERTNALAELGWDPSITWIGYIGGLVAWQGVDTAIKAFALIKHQEKARLVIAGDGPEMPRLVRLADDLGVTGAVDFLGRIERSKANLVINGFDLAVAPFTRRRNLEIGLSAVKIRDYAAAGRPVLSSRIPELIETDTADWIHFHEPDDPEGLARLMENFLNDPEKYALQRDAARSYAVAYFDWEHIAASLVAAMDRVSA